MHVNGPVGLFPLTSYYGVSLYLTPNFHTWIDWISSAVDCILKIKNMGLKYTADRM